MPVRSEPMRVARRATTAVTTVLALAVTGGANLGAYTIQWGDTLSAIAKKLELPVDVLAKANDIDDVDRIRQGRVLRVPTRTPPRFEPIAARSAPRHASPSVHVVVRGETLASIAARQASDVETLVRLNHIRDADHVTVGMRLRLPAGAAARSESPLCPVKGASRFDIASNFAAPRPGRKHQGNDIFARRGTPVIAPMDGTLRRADGGRAGKAFSLETVTGDVLYGAHLHSFAVLEGPVSRGTVIGAVGTTGNARLTPPHLHFEVHPRGGRATDPYPSLRSWCG